jgi:twitching motility protein PilJ
MPHKMQQRNSEFGDSQFPAYRRRGGAAPALHPRAADDGDAPLRLRDALGRRRNACSVDTGPGFNCR